MEERRMTRRGLFATLAALPAGAIAAPTEYLNPRQGATVARLKLPPEFNPARRSAFVYLDIDAPDGFIVNVNDRPFHCFDRTIGRNAFFLFVPREEFQSGNVLIRIASNGGFRFHSMSLEPFPVQVAGYLTDPEEWYLSTREGRAA